MYSEIRRLGNRRCSSSLSIHRLELGVLPFTIVFCSVAGEGMYSAKILKTVGILPVRRSLEQLLRLFFYDNRSVLQKRKCDGHWCRPYRSGNNGLGRHQSSKGARGKNGRLYNWPIEIETM